MSEIFFEGRLVKITKTKMVFRDEGSFLFELPYTDDALTQISKLKKKEQENGKLFNRFIDTFKFTVESRQITKVEIGKMKERLEEGAIDVDLELKSVPDKPRSRTGIILNELENLQRGWRGPAPKDELTYRVMKVSKLTRKEIEALINSLKENGTIYEPIPGFLSRIW
ncbi:MAG: hypothetical protein GTO54_10110 [Nitrososphaeria archaeon]|nr:hypothetical protein [Nitrososphaeria archaeon]